MRRALLFHLLLLGAACNRPHHAFLEEEVVVGGPEYPLPGILSRPVAAAPVPAVVLVHGSGPHDRDETVGGVKPFRDLARGLARRGVAVLRYDKRTRAHQQRLPWFISPREEVIDDAAAAAALLRRTPGIDPERVFVLGHSLGGMLAPRIAEAEPAIAGLVILAGPTRPLDRVVIQQMKFLGMGSIDLAIVEGELAKIDDPTWKEPIFGASRDYWLDLRAHEPAPLAARIPRPMLILQGERDYQVTMEDFAGWRKALSSRADVRFESYPDLNHLFVAGRGRSGPEEYARVGHVADEVLDDIAAWVLAR